MSVRSGWDSRWPRLGDEHQLDEITIMLTREEIRAIVREHLGKQIISPLTQRDAVVFVDRGPRQRNQECAKRHMERPSAMPSPS